MPASAFLYRTPESPTDHKHNHPQLMVGVSGISNVKIDGKENHLDFMKGFIIPPHTSHRFYGVGENSNLTINYDRKLSSDMTRRLFEKPLIFPLDQSMQKFVQFAALELPEFKGCSHIGTERFVQQIVNVFTGLLGDRVIKKPAPEPRIDLFAIDRYLDRHLDQKISVDELAKCVHVSPSHFFTLFRKEVGKTPHQYVIEKRLEKASFMLKATDRPIAEISADVGFSSQSAFSNAFKKQFGLTPGAIKYQDQ